MATLDALLPRELASWSLTHAHPTTTMPMTPPHTDRLHGRWVEHAHHQQHNTHQSQNQSRFGVATNFQSGHSGHAGQLRASTFPFVSCFLVKGRGV